MEELKTAIQNDSTPYIIVTGDFNADQHRSEFNLFFRRTRYGQWLPRKMV